MKIISNCVPTWLFIAISFYSSCVRASACPAHLAKLMENIHLVEKFPVLTLEGDQVVRGSLLQFKDSSFAFAVGPMMLIPAQGHKAMEAFLLEKNPGKKIAQRWHGELTLNNQTIVAANETSGYMKSLKKVSENQVVFLKRFLALGRIPLAVAEDVSYHLWPTDGHNPSPHLDETMSRIATEEGKNKSFLHSFYNTLTSPTYAIEIAQMGRTERLWK